MAGSFRNGACLAPVGARPAPVQHLGAGIAPGIETSAEDSSYPTKREDPAGQQRSVLFAVPKDASDADVEGGGTVSMACNGMHFKQWLTYCVVSIHTQPWGPSG